VQAARVGQGVARPPAPEHHAAQPTAVGLQRSVGLAAQQGHGAGGGGAVGGGGRGPGLVRRQVVAAPGSRRRDRCSAAATPSAATPRDAGVDVRGRPRGQKGRWGGVNGSLNGRGALGRVVQAEGGVRG